MNFWRWMEFLSKMFTAHEYLWLISQTYLTRRPLEPNPNSEMCVYSVNKSLLDSVHNSTEQSLHYNKYCEWCGSARSVWFGSRAHPHMIHFITFYVCRIHIANLFRIIKFMMPKVNVGYWCYYNYSCDGFHDQARARTRLSAEWQNSIEPMTHTSFNYVFKYT